MFEITTRLPNSFAFKNNPKHLLHQNHKYSTIFSSNNNNINNNSPPIYNRNGLNRDGMPIYFGHTTSSISSNNYLNHSHASMSSNFKNPRINSSPFIYDHSPIQHTMSVTEVKKSEPSINDNNITILPVYYKPEQTHLPSLRNSSTKSANHINKIQVTGSQVLPTIRNTSSNLGTQSYVQIHSHDPTSSFAQRNRPMNSMDQINLTPRTMGNSLNMSRINKMADGNQVIYNHDSDYLPTLSSHSTNSSENLNKISVIKSIKARQEMFMSRLKANAEEEEEKNQRMKYQFEKSKIDDENEMNLIKRNLSYMVVNNTSNNNNNNTSLSQVEANYRNTLNNTDKKLKNLKEHQINMDRLRMEMNDTPISGVSGSGSIRNNNNNNSFSMNCLNSGSSSNGKKSCLVRKAEKGIMKEKKSVSFAEI